MYSKMLEATSLTNHYNLKKALAMVMLSLPAVNAAADPFSRDAADEERSNSRQRMDDSLAWTTAGHLERHSLDPHRNTMPRHVPMKRSATYTAGDAERIEQKLKKNMSVILPGDWKCVKEKSSGANGVGFVVKNTTTGESYMVKQDGKALGADPGELNIAKALRIVTRMLGRQYPLGAMIYPEKITTINKRTNKQTTTPYLVSTWVNEYHPGFTDVLPRTEFIDLSQYMGEETKDGTKKKVNVYRQRYDVRTKLVEYRNQGTPVQGLVENSLVRIFFGDYSINADNNIVMKIYDGTGHLGFSLHAVGIDFGAWRAKSKNGDGSLFGREVHPYAKRKCSGFFKFGNKNFFKILDPFDVLSVKSVQVIEQLASEQFIQDFETEFMATMAFYEQFSEGEYIKAFYERAIGEVVQDERVDIDHLWARYSSVMRSRQTEFLKLAAEIVVFMKFCLQDDSDAFDDFVTRISTNKSLSGWKVRQYMSELLKGNVSPVLTPTMKKYYDPQLVGLDVEKGQKRWRDSIGDMKTFFNERGREMLDRPSDIRRRLASRLDRLQQNK